MKRVKVLLEKLRTRHTAAQRMLSLLALGHHWPDYKLTIGKKGLENSATDKMKISLIHHEEEVVES